jgi:hypothetical protein
MYKQYFQLWDYNLLLKTQSEFIKNYFFYIYNNIYLYIFSLDLKSKQNISVIYYLKIIYPTNLNLYQLILTS